MPGENCSIVGCGTNRRNKGISIFSLPNKKHHGEWREEWLSRLKRFREPDPHFIELIEKNHVYTCEKHFHPHELEYFEGSGKQNGKPRKKTNGRQNTYS